MVESLPIYSEFVRASLKLKDVTIHPLAGDASNRKYFRAIAGDETWVLMAWDPFEDNGRYPFLNVRDHFAKHDVRVPQVIAKDPARGLVLLEDLGDLTLERKFWESQNQQLVLPYYKQAVDELIKIHYPATFDRSDCVAFGIAFDTEKLLWEMNYGRDHLIVGLSQVKLTSVEAKALDRVFLKICQTLDAETKFIAHRDYHSRNVMLKLGKLRVIDFQDARMGAVQYDLVSLLRDSYVNLDEQMCEALLGYYLERRSEFKSVGHLMDVSREKFNHIFEMQTVQRCFKACGSFSSFYCLRQDTRYLKYIHQTLQTVKKSLEKFSEFAEFNAVLSDYGIYDRKFDDL